MCQQDSNQGLNTVQRAGWRVGRSISHEIDVALTAVGGYFPAASLTEDLKAVMKYVPEDWLAEWPLLFGQQGRLISVVSDLAGLAGQALEADYGKATMSMREMTLATALGNLTKQASAYGLEPDADLAPVEALAELRTRLAVALYASVGLDVGFSAKRLQRMRDDGMRVASFMRDGELHARFWHWIDRFYYQVYLHWRQSREQVLETLEGHGATMLGAREQQGVAPATDWLPAQNPLRVHVQLADAVQKGHLEVFFWAEPFGLTDLWALQPGLLLTSFSQPGAIYENFQVIVADIATRTKALADPTRLIILRLIRHFGMMNTEIANFLELARPTVSVHAKLLREAGLIRSQQQGREVHHEVVPSEIRKLFADLERFLDLPDE